MFLENMSQSFLTKNSYYLAKTSKKEPKMVKKSLKTSKNSKKTKLNYYVFLSLFLIYTVCNSQSNSEKLNPRKIVLIGNSITEYWQTYSPLFFEENSFLVNKGVSGQTSVEMLSRFQEDVIKQSPKAVYILVGNIMAMTRRRPIWCSLSANRWRTKSMDSASTWSTLRVTPTLEIPLLWTGITTLMSSGR
jgi:hypothetical protein